MRRVEAPRTRMRHLRVFVVSLLALYGASVQAALPKTEPTPEARAKAEAEKAADAKTAAAEKAAIGAAQERVAQRWLTRHPEARDKAQSPAAVEPVQAVSIPKAVNQETPAGPHGGSRQSAESHSELPSDGARDQKGKR